MQHETTIDLHRSAVMHARFPKIGIAQRNIDLFEECRQGHVDRLVDDDAERALVVVLANVDQGVGKVRIRHARHGDQEVMGQADPRIAHRTASLG